MKERVPGSFVFTCVFTKSQKLSHSVSIKNQILIGLSGPKEAIQGTISANLYKLPQVDHGAKECLLLCLLSSALKAEMYLQLRCESDSMEMIQVTLNTSNCLVALVIIQVYLEE